MRFGVEVVPGARSKRMSLLVAHGWNIELGAGRDSSRVSTAFGLGTHERVGYCTCTLLGPEGPGRLLPSGSGWISTLLDPFSTPGCVGEGYRPYFENYTVDASILDSGSLCGLFGSTRFARSSLRVVFLQIIGSATFRVVVS